jgi:lipopolysaccharide export system permease protein
VVAGCRLHGGFAGLAHRETILMLYLLSVLRRILSASLLALLAGLALYLIFDLIEHVRILLAYRAEGGLLGDLALAHLPTAIYQLLPLAILLGSLSVMGEMARDREILALAAAGQSLARRLTPFALAGIMIGILAWTIGEYVGPQAETTYRNLIDIQIKHKHRWGAKWRPHRAWYAGPAGIWRIGGGSGADLRNVTLYHQDYDGSMLSIEEMIGLHHNGDQWIARGWRQLDALGLETDAAPIRLMALHEEPEHFRMIWSDAQEMNTSALNHAISLRQAQGLDADGYRTERATRLAIPLLCILLPLSAPLVAWRRSAIGRRRGRLATLAVGIGLGLVIFLLLSIGRALASAGLLPAEPAVLAAPLIPAVITALGLRRIVL